MVDNYIQIKPLSPKVLLGVYAIVPVLFTVTVIDVWVFHSSLLPYMGVTSLLLPLYLIFFELPHIIASFFGFVDKEYIAHYRKHLLIGLPMVLVAAGVLLYLYTPLGILLYIVATMYHVIRQQTGVALILGSARGVMWQGWNGLAIALTSLAYVFLTIPNMLPVVVVQQFDVLLLFLLVGFVVCAWHVRTQTTQQHARRYVEATSLMIVASYIFLSWEYVFFAFFVIRFVHDVTAFMFYMTHDYNRNQRRRYNMIYSLFNRLPISVMVLVPVLSVALALLVREGTEGTVLALAIVILFGFAHYYLESIMWKRDSLHRTQILIR